MEDIYNSINCDDKLTAVNQCSIIMTKKPLLWYFLPHLSVF